MKNKFKFLCFCGLFLIFLNGCSFQNNKKITMAEYMKKVVECNAKFNNEIDEILDQIETYSGTESAKERLNNLIDSAISIIDYLKNDLGSKIPDEAEKHYKSMMEAYNLYKEGLELYRSSVPAPLGDERKNNIKSAEDKFEQALQKIKNIK